jgi:hypothetical protein
LLLLPVLNAECVAGARPRYSPERGCPGPYPPRSNLPCNPQTAMNNMQPPAPILPPTHLGGMLPPLLPLLLSEEETGHRHLSVVSGGVAGPLTLLLADDSVAEALERGFLIMARSGALGP